MHVCKKEKEREIKREREREKRYIRGNVCVMCTTVYVCLLERKRER
jgi:hypothetical protein